MSAVQEFQQSLSQLDTQSTIVTPDTFEETLRHILERPAVGAKLPFENISLSELPVTLEPSPAQLREATTGVTGSRLAISSLGTVVIESRTTGDEFVSLYPERHVVVVQENDLESDLTAAFESLEAKFDDERQSLILATGPSSTGDMGALVQGVHGPKEVHIVIVRNHE